eukprot:1145076-Pelagomonas_calceolata.AAC.1
MHQQQKANGAGAGWQNGKHANGASVSKRLVFSTQRLRGDVFNPAQEHCCDAAHPTKHRRVHSGSGEEQLGPSPSPPHGSLYSKPPPAPPFKQHPSQQQPRGGGGQN